MVAGMIMMTAHKSTCYTGVEATNAITISCTFHREPSFHSIVYSIFYIRMLIESRCAIAVSLFQ